MTKHLVHKIAPDGMFIEDVFWDDEEVLEVIGNPVMTNPIEAVEAFAGVPATLELEDGTLTEIFTENGDRIWKELPRKESPFIPSMQQTNPDGSLAWSVEPVAYKPPLPRPPDLVLGVIPPGLGWPKWNGKDWTEGRDPAVMQAAAIERTTRILTEAVQNRLDEEAMTRGYDNILSACTYALDLQPQFQKEGRACIKWRGATWKACYDLLAQVKAGTRAIPTKEELLALLPILNWEDT